MTGHKGNGLDRTMKNKKNLPNPGSSEAKENGCKCPILDNHCGRGAFDDGVNFWVSSNCPLHGMGTKEDEGDKDEK